MGGVMDANGKCLHGPPGLKWLRAIGVLVAVAACSAEPASGDGDEEVSAADDDLGGDDDPGGDGQTLFAEIQVSPDEIVDFEFDWGRDGVHCATCNEGDGNSRFVFTDHEQNLWLGHVDPETGDFDPPDGRAVWLDDNAAFATDFGNGPEWMFSTRSSAIVYTKYDPGAEQSTFTAAVALATPSES